MPWAVSATVPLQPLRSVPPGEQLVRLAIAAQLVQLAVHLAQLSGVQLVGAPVAKILTFRSPARRPKSLAKIWLEAVASAISDKRVQKRLRDVSPGFMYRMAHTLSRFPSFEEEGVYAGQRYLGRQLHASERQIRRGYRAFEKLGFGRLKHRGACRTNMFEPLIRGKPLKESDWTGRPVMTGGPVRIDQTPCPVGPDALSGHSKPENPANTEGLSERSERRESQIAYRDIAYTCTSTCERDGAVNNSDHSLDASRARKQVAEGSRDTIGAIIDRVIARFGQAFGRDGYAIYRNLAPDVKRGLATLEREGKLDDPAISAALSAPGSAEPSAISAVQSPSNTAEPKTE
jgi:hypothetical protein